MKQRIMAAWKVLRGEWTASAPAPVLHTSDTGTTANTTYTFSFTPQAAGRRAVRKHGDALRRLAR